MPARYVAQSFPHRPAYQMLVLAGGQCLSFLILIWMASDAPAQEGLTPLLCLLILATVCFATLVLWLAEFLRFSFLVRAQGMARQAVYRWLTGVTVVFAIAWSLMAAGVLSYAQGGGMNALLFSLQLSALLASHFYVHRQVKRLIWILLFLQGASLAVITIVLGEGRDSYLQMVATVIVLATGYAISMARGRIHATMQRRHSELNEERSYLAQQIAHLQEANAGKTRLLATVSHDLRQPVHALGLMLGRLRRDANISSQRPEVEAVNEVVNSLSKSLSMLMALTRLDSGLVISRPEPISLEKMFDSLCNEFQDTASSGGLQLEFHSGALNVLTDPSQLRTILSNLISNAIKYSLKGAVRVSASLEGPEMVAIKVQDTGIGIPADELTRIFEPFVRLRYGKDSAEGLGLGLSIVKQTADILKAPIDVTSTFGAGTTFTITLPRSESSEGGDSSVRARESGLRGLRIIVVDNDEPVLESTARTLEEWGCRVIAASSWPALEAKLEMTVSPMDLILTDFHLDAGVSGYELIQWVRQRQEKQIPAILLTGDVEIRHGADSTAEALTIAYKPLPYEKLANLILETVFPSQWER